MGPTLIIVIVAVLIVLALAFFVSYNKFVRQRHTIEESWRQIDVELQRRHDLIPNLIDTVRAAAAFEQATLQQVMNARAAAMQARQHGAGHAQQGVVEGQLSGALHGFFGLAENYPQLRASSNFAHLQQQFADTEDRIAAGRRFYNGNVREYNARLQTIPSNIVGKMASFQPAEYFEIEEQARAVPRVGNQFDSLHQPQVPQHGYGPQAHSQQPQQLPPSQQPGMPPQQQSYQQPPGHHPPYRR